MSHLIQERDDIRRIATNDRGQLLSEISRLKATLSVATRATTCAGCGVYKMTPTRRHDAYICAGCLEKECDTAIAERDSLRSQLSTAKEAIRVKDEALSIVKAELVRLDDSPELVDVDFSKEIEVINKALSAAEGGGVGEE